MPVESKETTEDKILAAAEVVFLRDGYAGSRMQDIADTANINKAMLHYYFRNKDKLFEQIFDKNTKILFPQFEEILAGEHSFTATMHMVVEKYFEVLIANPFIPLFVITAVNDPERAYFLEKFPYSINRKLAEKYFSDYANGFVKKINPFQFIVSVMAMCFFPFMAKPIIVRAIDGSGFQFDQLMSNRTEELKIYITSILKP